MAESPMIFISYRRDDSSGHVGRLYDTLASHYGARRIFVDIDHIGAGEDFVRVLDEAIGKSRIMLVVIGKHWQYDDAGYSRLGNPNDFVRLEVVAGLQHGLRVIPLLVQGATMPSPTQLPRDLQELSTRNAMELSDVRWKEDVARLESTLDKLMREMRRADIAREVEERAALPREPRTPRERLRMPKVVWLAVVLIAAGIAIVGYVRSRAPSPYTSVQQPYSTIPNGDVPDPPSKLEDKASSALADAHKWRADAQLWMISVESSGQSGYFTTFNFASPRDGAGLTVADLPTGRQYVPSSGGADVDDIIPIPFMELTDAIGIARETGMHAGIARAVLAWHRLTNGRLALIWTLTPAFTSGESFPYNVDVVTAKVIPIQDIQR